MIGDDPYTLGLFDTAGMKDVSWSYSMLILNYLLLATVL